MTTKDIAAEMVSGLSTKALTWLLVESRRRVRAWRELRDTTLEFIEEAEIELWVRKNLTADEILEVSPGEREDIMQIKLDRLSKCTGKTYRARFNGKWLKSN